MCTANLDHVPRVASANGDDSGSACQTSLNPTGRVFKDHAIGWMDAQAFGRQDEWIRGRFPCFETFVVGCDGDLGWDNPDTLHASVGYLFVNIIHVEVQRAGSPYVFAPDVAMAYLPSGMELINFRTPGSILTERSTLAASSCHASGT